MSLSYVQCCLVLKTEYDVDRGEQVKRMVTFKVARVSKYHVVMASLLCVFQVM